MKKLILFFLLIFISFPSFAQKRIIENEMGFHCSVDGSPTKVVRKFSKLLFKTNHKKIIRLLNSNDNAEKFLAVIVSERLNKQQKIILTDKELKKISIIRSSNDIISVCDGCVYYTKMSLKDFFEEIKNPKDIFYIQSENWMDYCQKIIK